MRLNTNPNDLPTQTNRGKVVPIYEYECRKCGEVSSFYEKVDERKFWGRKCEQCGSRKLKKLPTAFSTSVQRTQTELMNEMKQMGNVQFTPKHVPPWGTGPPPGGCPYENMKDGEGGEEKTPQKTDAYEVKS